MHIVYTLEGSPMASEQQQNGTQKYLLRVFIQKQKEKKTFMRLLRFINPRGARVAKKQHI